MEDYRDAAKRHFEDAELLRDQTPQRLANASHLYGFAGECVLKSMMAGTKNQRRVPQKHLPDIMTEFVNHSSAKGNEALVRRVKTCHVGLSNWQVSERYLNRHAIGFTVERVQSEADSAKKLIGLLSLWIKGAA